VELGRIRAGVIGNYGVVRKMHLVQCCADSVEHDASPSHRDMSRRVVLSPVINFSPPQPNIEMSGAATPRTSVRSVLNRIEPGSTPPAGFAFLRCCFGPVRLFSFEARKAHGRNLNTGQPFSYCYEFTNPASLGKRRYAHTAADLHVRSGSSNRAGLENRRTPRAI
jgi:hypothetical protein